MICEHCGKPAQAAKKQSKDPWCMYQVKDGAVINQLFHPDRIPDGWYDSPKAAKAALEKPKPAKIDLRTKEGRAMKAKSNDDSARTD